MKKAVTFFMLLLPMIAAAQFNEAIGTYKDQQGRSVQRTRFDPGFIVAGEDNHSVFGGNEASLVKTELDGTLQWSIVYGGIGQDAFSSVRQADAHATLPIDGYGILGSTTSFTNNEDLYFIRTDSLGTPLYSITFGRKEGQEKGHCLQYIKDRSTGRYGYVMVGQTNSYSYYGYTTDILIIKIDEDGNLVRAKVMGAQGEDIAYWIEQTSDGGFIMTGSTIAPSETDRNIFVVKLDMDLNLTWQYVFKHCEVSYDDAGYGVVENPADGSFTVTGFTASFGLINSRDAFLLNLQPNGTVNWMRTYGTKYTEQGVSIHVSDDGKDYVVSGFAKLEDGSMDALVFKTDMAGNPDWSNLYGSSFYEGGAEITSDGGSGYIFTGFAGSTYTINTDFYLVNLSSGGKSYGCQKEFSKEWKAHTPCTTGYFQDVDINDLRFVCTQYERVDYQVQRCSAEKSLGALSEPEPSAKDAFTAVPNPSSTSVQILFRDTALQKRGGTLVVYNRNGKIVYTTAITSGDMHIPVNDLPSDLYMIRFTTSDGKQYQNKFIKK